MYAQLLNVTSDPVFHQGQWTPVGVAGSDSCWRLLAWKWTLGSTKRLVVLNYRCAFVLPSLRVDGTLTAFSCLCTATRTAPERSC